MRKAKPLAAVLLCRTPHAGGGLATSDPPAAQHEARVAATSEVKTASALTERVTRHRAPSGFTGQEPADEDVPLLLVFKSRPPHERRGRNLYEFAREVKGFVDSPRFPPTGVETERGVRYGVFAAKRAKVLKTTDSGRSPRSSNDGAYVLVLDPIYTVCAKNYKVRAARSGKGSVTYTDCEGGAEYEIPLRKREPPAIYEVEVLTGDIFRELWREKVGARGQGG